MNDRPATQGGSAVIVRGQAGDAIRQNRIGVRVAIRCQLSSYPDLIIVLLGFKVRQWRALPALFGIGRGLAGIRAARPDGLLGDERFLLGWSHLGIRQYWRDAESLARFTRDTPHAGWWRDFLRDTKGCGFWHEAYHARGGVEAIYVGMPERTGLSSFAPIRKPVGPLMSSHGRVTADAGARGR